MENQGAEYLYQIVKQRVEELEDDIISLVQDLVRIPSINHPPTGDEGPCQKFIEEYMINLGLTPDVYSPQDVEGIKEHPAWYGGRDYANRPNITVRRPGAGNGRSLVLSGHIDTVPLGVQPWQHDPFKATIEQGKLYGLGAFDMKGGIAAELTALRVIQELQIPLKGDLIVETVVDEEFGGVNGTLAGRVRGYVGDGMIITEPSGLVIWNGDRGGRFAHITFRAAEGIGFGEDLSISAVDQATVFLQMVDRFRQQRRASFPDWDAQPSDPIPVWVTKIFAGGWGFDVPITVPSECRIELYWQLEPGSDQEEVDAAFFSWLDSVTEAAPELFRNPPEVEFPIRFMPGAVLPPDAKFIEAFRGVSQGILGQPVKVEIAPGPSDLFVVNKYFPRPAIMFGTRGGNAHAADEYLMIDDLVPMTEVLVRFALEWCGLATD